MNSDFGDEQLTSMPRFASTVVRQAGQCRLNASTSITEQDTSQQSIDEEDFLHSVTSEHNSRNQRAMSNPYFIMGDVRRLAEVYKSYGNLYDEVLQILVEVDAEVYEIMPKRLLLP